MFEIIDSLVGKEIRIIGKRQEKYIGQVCEGANCDFTYHDEELTRFCALVHDFGKGATPREEWPHHYGHEEKYNFQFNTLRSRVYEDCE